MDDSESSKSIVSFPGVKRCALCGDSHDIKLLYKDTPILICPKAEVNNIYFFKEEIIVPKSGGK